MASDQQFCLRWNNHQNTLVSLFDSLLESGTLVDCTLAAEGRFIQAHKVVLSACSPYFAMLLREHNEKYPILILKDIKYQELLSMMNYMYRGEVNITQETLGSFLKAAESLQIRGLTDSSNSGSNNGSNCVESNNGVTRGDPTASASTHPYHTSSSSKKVPDSRKLVAPVTPLLSQQRSRSPVMLSQQGKKYMKSSPVVENHHSNNSKSSSSSAVVESVMDAAVNNTNTVKRRKLLPPIKSDGLVVTPINPNPSTTSAYNSLDLVNNTTCDVPSQAQSMQTAIEGRANVPSPASVPPKVESPHMDITPVGGVGGSTSKAPSAAGSTTSVTPEPVVKTKSLMSSELVKVKKEELDDSYNEDTNDDSYTTEDNFENEREEAMQLMSAFNQSGANFDNLPDRTLALQDGNSSLQDASGFAFNQYWLSNWEYNSKYVRLTETNPFSCQHCGKRYRWKSTLKRHESFECGNKEPVHKCPHCDYRAKQSGNLRVHIRKYHTDRASLGGNSVSGTANLSVVNDLLPAASSGK